MRCPAQFCEFRSEFLTSYLNHMCKQIACLPACLFFQTSYGRFRIFRIVVSVVSIERKKKEKKAGIECGGRCMINVVPKNHIPICNIERGMANLPLWQHLGWPINCSYLKEVIPKIRGTTIRRTDRRFLLIGALTPTEVVLLVALTIKWKTSGVSTTDGWLKLNFATCVISQTRVESGALSEVVDVQ